MLLLTNNFVSCVRGDRVYCFWMKGENLFEAGGDGGSDNIAMQISDKCQYKKDDVVVYCAP